MGNYFQKCIHVRTSCGHGKRKFIFHNRAFGLDLGGKLLWDSQTTGRADMYASAPVTWNLTDRAGSKVTRGIYLYKTTVTTGGQSSTMTKRIAVAPL